MRPADCLAIHDGETNVEGLDGPVTITRDRWGIPHIKASSAHDAFFAQGFCMAQDRAWQIELIRHMAHGRAASLLNRGLLNLDRQNRLLGFNRYAEREWQAQSPAARRTLEAYAAGINAAIATQPQPYEFRIIGHKMAPWSPIDSLAIIKLVNSGQQWATKLKFGQVASALGAEAVNALVPEVPAESVVITPPGVRWTGAVHPFAEDISLAMGEPDGPVPAGGGSNCWVIAGSRTPSGRPLVAGDPHLQMSLPAQWYVVHMECPEFTAAGPCNPGYPGPVFYGHNTNVAWTMTHAQGDRWDVYRERIRQGDSGPEALNQERWEPLTRIDETFEVKGEQLATGVTWLTRHGPVVFGNPERDDEVLAARWGLAEPAHDVDAMLAVLHATNGAEAREGFRLYDSVSGNFCFASLEGDIGYQYSGRIPRRPAWLTPVPGWDGLHEWDGDVPKQELPIVESGSADYIVTANNRTTTPDYPHYLTFVATRFRADRLTELIEQHAVIGPDETRAFQSDVVSIHARDLGRRFAGANTSAGGAETLRALFDSWDGNLSADSAVALAFDEFCEQLAARTVRPFYGRAETIAPLMQMEERRIVYEQFLADAPLMLPEGATWDGVLAEAMLAAWDALAAAFGDDTSRWRWGDRHRLAWRHNLGRSQENAATLNLEPVPVGGDANTPFNTASEGGGLVTVSVSYRQVFDLADLNAAQVCIPPGNSGAPGSPHYSDNVERWRSVEYHPLFINWDDIEANAGAHLTLR